ncbi:NAD(P)/FAD-dependent oxidoreductase [Pseudoalteromonas sp. JBTF-M23]|uniref:NAD(P)/FAD-dependent oxidoreductase n=1 Tax=Pseudoalteromonas caenipelagi TaxID=2726988 RepID=A0A849VMF1_9GAMM|nr:NAD(P)/FAD-dependent oxidoreductase [Pseudoalteromonas caenipelagi]NOU52894.1 NAD(P)/FAD-dependent oxidoreductase [Pseudoalteromonas caenipelagi]
MEHIETLVIGAGVVGLAIAATLSEHQDVIVIEQNTYFGEHTSSRNSEVVHAGIYYPSNSLKARLCVEGKTLLYQHCQKYHVPFKKVGKVLVAHGEGEKTKLNTLVQQAKDNGVRDLTFLSQAELAQKAPQIKAPMGVWSPSTGIIDSHQLMLSYLNKLSEHKGQYVNNTRFVSAQFDGHYFVVTLNCDGELFNLKCTTLINAAGLFAQSCAKQIDALNARFIPELHYCKGQYFSYQGSHPFKHLIYPMPEQHGLGVHATIDLAGQLKFGPDTSFIDELDYTPNEQAKARFVSEINKYWPSLDSSRLQLSYCGIRPKLYKDAAQDFVIQDHSVHGVKGLINLFGVESPGLTASLAIAQYVSKKVSYLQ